MEEAIQDLLGGHTETTCVPFPLSDGGGEETESTKQRSHSADEADQAEPKTLHQSLKGKSDSLEFQLKILKDAKKATDQACDSEPLDRGRNTTAGDRSTELTVPGQHGVWLSRYWEGISEKAVPSSQQNTAIDAHTLEWTQKTIESVTKTLTQEQFGEGTDLEFSPPGSSPPVNSSVILSDQLQQRISPLEKQLADLQWQRNTMIPIAHIPSEILIDIFDFILDGQPHWRDDTSVLLTVLTRICRDWTRLVDTAPRLWSRISPRYSTIAHVATALDKSKPSPLSLHFDEDEMGHIRSDNFFSAIGRHADRWKVLELRLRSAYTLRSINSQLANVFPPRLESLRVSQSLKGAPPVQSMEPLKIYFFKEGWHDTLRQFRLDGIGMPPKSYAELRGLKVLEIWPPPLPSAVDVTQIVRVLSNCPELEKLLLGDRIGLGGELVAGTLNLEPPVRLDYLREISLWLHPAPLHALLRSIQAVNCTNYRIETSLPPEDERAWTEVLLTEEIRPFIRAMESVLLSASEIDIEARSYGVKLETKPQGSGFRVCLGFHGGQGAEVGRWIAECLALGQAPVTLDIVARGTVWIEIVPLMLSKLYNTVKLTLYGDGTICQHAIDFLGTVLYTDPAGYQHFPIPRLTSLMVTLECLPTIISILERRYGQHESTEITSAKPPVRLSKLGLLGSRRTATRENTLVQQLISALPGCEVEFK